VGVTTGDLEIKPLTPRTWGDFESLFGPRGAYSGCWCMWWRLSRSEFTKGQGEANRRAMRALVVSGVVPGVIAFRDGRPCGWCSIAPREQFGTLERSRVLKRLDRARVWSIVCMFIDRKSRGRGLAEKLIRGAVEYARTQGAKVVEAYPTVPRKGVLAPVSNFMGIPGVFKRAGFSEVARPSPSRAIMRRNLK
jgi:GNAT superfamily N-acetyltransferase